ncbi:MAG: RHS repeat domain-containing protein [Thermoguttaceae bacterium]
MFDGNMLSLTDPDNNTTNWTYDGLGREIQQSETVALGYKPGTTTSLGTTTATYNYQLPITGHSFPSIWRAAGI